MREWIWKLVRKILFRLDAERAHRLTVDGLQIIHKLCPPALSIIAGTQISGRALPEAIPKPKVFGLEFRNRLGLAAGFDKDAELVELLPAFGFGFVEIGTVTPRPQAGNERPRLFRIPEAQALFNRMGFNGAGAAVVSQRLERKRPALPADFRIGVNLGKNKDTPANEAARDYCLAAAAFRGLADYLVINVSSPNTPGLRSLQTAEALKPIVSEVLNEITGWPQRPPLLLKLAPELENTALADLLRSVEDFGIDGWVLTNTLGGTWPRVTQSNEATLTGGWSGLPVRAAAQASLALARSVSSLPIISVGGILDPQEARHRIVAGGASLVQIYAGWVFGGPRFPSQVARAISLP